MLSLQVMWKVDGKIWNNLKHPYDNSSDKVNLVIHWASSYADRQWYRGLKPSLFDFITLLVLIITNNKPRWRNILLVYFVCNFVLIYVLSSSDTVLLTDLIAGIWWCLSVWMRIRWSFLIHLRDAWLFWNMHDTIHINIEMNNRVTRHVKSHERKYFDRIDCENHDFVLKYLSEENWDLQG